MNTLDLALIGNCTVGALVDARAKIVWGCFPRFDGDPVFCSLLRNTDDYGFSAIELADCERTEQHYLENTAILVTRLYDCHGGGIEVTDFAPRFGQYGRMFRPMMLVRRIRRLGGSPRLTLRVRPACNDGTARPEVTWGSNHIRYVTQGLTLRLTTDASLTAILQETAFFLEDTVTLLLGADESVHEAANEVGRRFLAETTEYWSEWVRFLGIPFEWQEAVIRAAITLKLNAYDDTGAIVAAMTTSIPEAAGSERNWDYRYCWVRDGYFVVNALNRLGATRTMERYLGYIVNVAANAGDGVLQPVYGIDGRAALDEREVPSLAGYRGMGPVRIGNLAYRQVQHDVYGSVILAATHIFFDQRLTRRGDEALFHRLEVLGEQARRCYDQPDAGLWELRGSARVHTFSAVMCWAACDRLARIAEHLGLAERAAFWSGHASLMHATISGRAWNTRRGAARSCRLLMARRWTPACCCWPKWASSMPPIRALMAPSPQSKRTCVAATSSSAMSKRTTSASRKMPFWCAPSGMSMPWRRWIGARKPARCSKSCWPAAIPTACWRNTSIRAAANNGATSCRPTAWLG